MADRNTDLDLGDLHTAIETTIRAAFPALQLVEFYSDVRDHLPMPACLLELTELEAAPEIDPGSEQLAVNARFEARFVLGFQTPKARLEVRKLAAAFAAWLRKNQRAWGLPTGPAQVIGAYQDDFYPKLDQFEVWRVEWVQVLHLGIGIWTDTTGDIDPSTLNPSFGYAPDVGSGNEDKYEEVKL